MKIFTINNLKKALKSPKIALSYLWGLIGYWLGLIIPGSQFGEDLILSYLTPKKNGFYVDIGANDPCMGSNSYLFYVKGWNGISVEPNKRLYKKICKYRKNAINLNLAVGSSGGNLKYYEFDADGMSTCDESIMKSYTAAGHVVTDTYTTPVASLAEIFEKYLGDHHIDILSIDVEGMDMEVLKSNDWTKYIPDYIVVETLIYVSDNQKGIENQSEYDEYMNELGYVPVASTYVNTIYKHKSI